MCLAVLDVAIEEINTYKGNWISLTGNRDGNTLSSFFDASFEISYTKEGLNRIGIVE